MSCYTLSSWEFLLMTIGPINTFFEYCVYLLWKKFAGVCLNHPRKTEGGLRFLTHHLLMIHTMNICTTWCKTKRTPHFFIHNWKALPCRLANLLLQVCFISCILSFKSVTFWQLFSPDWSTEKRKTLRLVVINTPNMYVSRFH